jgi:Sulfotransferase family
MIKTASTDSMIKAAPRPLFVLSVWRSGSSLLHALLNQHSKIALLYEGELPQLQPLLRGRFRDGGWREKWEFWNEGPSRHGIAIDSMPANVSNAWEAARIVYQEFAARKEATIWGEKSPHWYNNALQMAQKFPDAQLIFLWRNAGDVMESIARASMTERFFRKPGFAARVLVGSEKLRDACDILHAQGRSVHQVNYEDLISNTSGCMKGICQFLQIPFESQIASLEGADRSSTFSGDHHALVRGTRIVTGKKCARVLAPAMRAKVERYLCRWNRRYHGKWPEHPPKLPRAIEPPGALELFRDRVVYRALLGWDNMVKLIYAVVPLTLARSLRSWLRQRTHTKQSFQLSQ